MLMVGVVVITRPNKNNTQEQLFHADGGSSGYKNAQHPTHEQLVIASASGNGSMRESTQRNRNNKMHKSRGMNNNSTRVHTYFALVTLAATDSTPGVPYVDAAVKAVSTLRSF